MATTDFSSITVFRAISGITAIGALITGGALFAFSTFVMPGLDRAPAAAAIPVMQAINVQAPRSLLMLPLLGSALGGAVIAVYAIVRSAAPGRGWLIAGGIAAAATLVITGIYHIPHNDALARIHPQHATAAAWAQFSTPWTRWNHVRTLSALVGGLLLAVGATRR